MRRFVAFELLLSLAHVAVACSGVGLSRCCWQVRECLLALFDSLKAPIVVPDIAGNINSVNRACSKVLGRDAAEIKDASFFSVFSQPDQRGQSIERYLRLFDMDLLGQESMMVSVPSVFSARNMQATCSLLPVDGRMLLVSQLDSLEPSPSRCA